MNARPHSRAPVLLATAEGGPTLYLPEFPASRRLCDVAALRSPDRGDPHRSRRTARWTIRTPQIFAFASMPKGPACAHPMFPTGADRKFLVMMPDRTTKFFLGSERVKPGHHLRAGRGCCANSAKRQRWVLSRGSTRQPNRRQTVLLLPEDPTARTEAGPLAR